MSAAIITSWIERITKAPAPFELNPCNTEIIAQVGWRLAVPGNPPGQIGRRKKRPGLYGQLRAGAGRNRQLKGALWLANAAGVQMHLVANPQGLALIVSADGLVIDFGGCAVVPPRQTSRTIRYSRGA